MSVASADRRRLFAEALVEQISLLDEGRSDPGELPHPDRPPRVWWWQDEDGYLVLTPRFRGRPVAVSGSRTTAVVTELAEVRWLLEGLRLATLKGHLDGPLAAIDGERWPLT